MGKRLVRDHALKNWVVPGAEHQLRRITGTHEHNTLLAQKLLEECGEVIVTALSHDPTEHDNLTKEIVDVLSVLEAIAYIHGIYWDDVLHTQDERELTSGPFTQGLVWETPR